MVKKNLIEIILKQINNTYQDGSGVHHHAKLGLEKMNEDELDSLMVMILTSQK